MIMTRYQLILAVVSGMLITFSLHANPILPGQTVSPDVFPNPGSVPLLHHTSGTFSFGSGIGLIAGTYTEDVAVRSIRRYLFRLSGFCLSSKPESGFVSRN